MASHVFHADSGLRVSPEPKRVCGTLPTGSSGGPPLKKHHCCAPVDASPITPGDVTPLSQEAAVVDRASSSTGSSVV